MSKMAKDEVRKFAITFRNAVESVAKERQPGFKLGSLTPSYGYVRALGVPGNDECVLDMKLDWWDITMELDKILSKK